MHKPHTLTLFAAALLAGCTTLTPTPQPDTPIPPAASFAQGRSIFLNECAQCHAYDGTGAGAASLGLGTPPPDLSGLTARNDGAFPRAFVQRFILGQIEKEDPEAPMPDFASIGLQHAYPEGTSPATITNTDMIALLDYLETLQK